MGVQVRRLFLLRDYRVYYVYYVTMCYYLQLVGLPPNIIWQYQISWLKCA